MKQATFPEGIAIALIASVMVAALFSVMSSLFIGGNLFMLLVAAVSFFYILYLLLRSKERVGRVTVLVSWFVITLGSLVFVSSVLLYLAIQLCMIWLVRSVYFYNSLFSALIDLAMTSMSFVVALWTLNVSGSLFLTFWSFFLVQALFVYIPTNFTGKNKVKAVNCPETDRFEYAYHAAEVAVTKLAKSH